MTATDAKCFSCEGTENAILWYQIETLVKRKWWPDPETFTTLWELVPCPYCVREKYWDTRERRNIR